ncbi:uncharacterized protein LACBIDRAFT_253463 [Laccaria bicolor S238N-H82]|uniref:Predicted protein n=1 Tax=Laccaria bicolor (strain S238N-H82 / ATCC MYA-4686) TaxID=486041 RepID=B0DQ41_LACBS|nr:uncharacterized protein LACBIDRAFT_253463 [Laccaria bicolor S238N-H82]EDR03225.1 predicted protein [Laccaria bicolor S238N-H82]|eukprot:XP_001886021.1 predicted protein [Laccaria bicolor S238N-H82]
MGILAVIRENLPPKPTFKVDDVPDLEGKVIIITGANAGEKLRQRRQVYPQHGVVYIAGRSQERVEQAIQDIKAETGKDALFLKLDLADLTSVKAAAEEFQRKETRLDVLYNNAGVLGPPIADVTAQGYDLQFGTNTLGHFYFTKLLLPTLLASAKTSPDGKVRVINVSSAAHHWHHGSIDFNILKDCPARKKKSGLMLYGQSKLGNILFSNELFRRYAHEGVISTSIHPGNLRSDLYRHMSRIENFVVNLILYPSAMGALTLLWAGTTDEGLTLGGKYLIPWARVGTPNASARDPKLAEELWTWMEEQVQNI